MDDARRAFLAELIDDAGLFPPASLSMENAVAAHRRSRGGPSRWMLGRIICPADRLGELQDAREAAPVEDEPPCRISVLAGAADGDDPWPASLEPALKHAAAFGDRAGDSAAVELVETRLPDQGPTADSLIGTIVVAMDRFSEAIPGSRPFLEVPFGPEWRETVPAALRALAGVRELVAGDSAVSSSPPGAKIRCGGATAGAFPSPEQVAAFITFCRDLAVPFKATAGLHHPFRHVDPATGFTRHGFLNVAGAAILAHARALDEATLADLIADDRPEDFALTADGFRWRDLEANAAEIETARRQLFVGYGSCSFDEPVEDLLAVGVLPVGA